MRPVSNSRTSPRAEATSRLTWVFYTHVVEKLVAEAPPVQDRLRSAFEEHATSLLRLCLLLTSRREEAEDLVQEAFVRLAPKVQRLEPDAVGPYLRRIAINVWKNRLRRLAAEFRARSRAGPESPGPDPGAPDHAALDREVVLPALRALPPRQRACVVLRHYLDLPEREVAEMLGCSIGTVKSQTRKALARLREELGDED